MTKEDDLLQVFEARTAEVKAMVDDLSEKVGKWSTIQGQVLAIKNDVERLRQEVKEYRGWKDPLMTGEHIRALQKVVSSHANLVADLNNRLTDYESKQWMRIVTDDELEAQYELAGFPSMKDIADKFHVSVENAYNYAHAKIQDPKVRWQIFRYFGGS